MQGNEYCGFYRLYHKFKQFSLVMTHLCTLVGTIVNTKGPQGFFTTNVRLL